MYCIYSVRDMDSNDLEAKLEGRYNGIVVCWLLGNGCLFAWSSMLTIIDYYHFLFHEYHPSRILGLVYQTFTFGGIGIFAYNEAKINTRFRNLFGYTLFFLASLAVLVLDLANLGRGKIGYFVGVCVISAIFGIADAHVQGGMIGDLSLMTPQFLQAYLAGLAVSGTLISGLRLITKGVFKNSRNGLRKGAILFFAISAFFEFLCILLYAYVFPRLPIVRYYRARAASQGSKTVTADLTAGGFQDLPDDEVRRLDQRLSNKQLLLHNLDYAINLFLVYMLTLSIIPGFLSEDTGKHSLGDWYPVVLIAMYNMLDLVGRYIPCVERLKIKSRKCITISVISRFMFVPAFYFAAKYANQSWMIFLTSFLGLSNGYFTVCILTSAPKGYKAPEQNALGNLLVLFLTGGMFIGVTCDWLWLIGKGW